MENCRRNSISEYNDISTIDQYQEALRAGCTEEEALEYCYKYSRDNARTPMQWNDDVNGGFTKGRPWLAMNPDYTCINVEEQEKREDSVLSCYKKVIALRKAPEYRETFTYGRFLPDYEDHDYIFAYHRKIEGTGQDILIAANYGKESDTITLQEGTEGTVRKVLLSTSGREEEISGEMAGENAVTLGSCEAVVILL